VALGPYDFERGVVMPTNTNSKRVEEMTKPAPRVIFRFLTTKVHAEDFVRGHVWLSTFDHIRNCDLARADSEDGNLQYLVSNLDADTMPRSEVDVIQQRLKAFRVFGGDSIDHVKVSDIAVSTTPANAYVICATTDGGEDKHRRVFGEHRVRIVESERVFRFIGAALNAKVRLTGARYAPVEYKGRTFEDADAAVGSPGFASVEINAWEKEVRMIWQPQDYEKILPIELDVPEIAKYCSLD
jgi:hypothetical protein